MSTSAPSDRPSPAPIAPLRRPPRPAREELPTSLDPLIGREREVAALTALLGTRSARLVVLTGPGGVGKTRLALAVAAAVGDEFADGAVFLPLAHVRDRPAPFGDRAPALVAATIAQALGVRDVGDQALPDRLRAVLRERDLRLVLDNFEHLLSAASLVSELLAACPRLTALVTSRARLNLAGERDFPVPPLAVPERSAASDLVSHPIASERAAGDADRGPPADPSANRLDEFAAVRLFVERAQGVNPSFALTAANAPRSSRSAAVSTDCPSPSSWRRRGRGCCRRRRCWPGWSSGCRC